MTLSRHGSSNGYLVGLLGDPSIYTAAHQQLLEMETRERHVEVSLAREHEKLKAKEAYLATERQRLDAARVAHNATKATARAAKQGLQLCLLEVLKGTQEPKEGPSTSFSQLECKISRLQADHAKELTLLEEECQKLLDAHNQVQSSSEERLQTQEETLLTYSE
jgi:hypothetical protein